MTKEFFPRQSHPQIYAYEDNNPIYKGLLKVGYTTKQDVAERVADQYPTLRPGEPPYKIVFSESSMREDGSYFTDHDVHKWLRLNGFDNPDGEWFKCTVKDVQSAVFTLKNRIENSERNFAQSKKQQSKKQ